MEALKLLDDFEKTVKGIAKEYYRTFEWKKDFEEIRNTIKSTNTKHEQALERSKV